MAYLNPEDIHLEVILFSGHKEIKRQRLVVTKARSNRRTGQITVFTEPAKFHFDEDAFVTHYAFGLQSVPYPLGKTRVNEQMQKDWHFTMDWSAPKRPTIILH